MVEFTFVETQKTVKKTQKTIYYLNIEKQLKYIFIVLKKSGF